MTKVSISEYTLKDAIVVCFWGDLMESKYQIGQRVIAKLARGQTLSARDSNVEQYAGQNGIILDFYWIRPNAGQVFFIYTVKMEESEEEVVLYEDEIEPY